MKTAQRDSQLKALFVLFFFNSVFHRNTKITSVLILIIFDMIKILKSCPLASVLKLSANLVLRRNQRAQLSGLVCILLHPPTPLPALINYCYIFVPF